MKIKAIQSVIGGLVTTIMLWIYLWKIQFWIITKPSFIPLDIWISGSCFVILVVSIVLIHLLLFRFVWPRFSNYSLISKLMWGSVCLGIAASLTVVIPIKPVWPHRLEIVATGQKNLLAQGSQVWLLGIEDGHNNLALDSKESIWGKRNTFGNINGNSLSPFVGEGWQKNNQRFVSEQNQPATLNLQWAFANNSKLNFMTGLFSGIVQISSGQEVLTIDLYDQVRSKKEIVLLRPNWFEYLLYGLYIISIAYLVFFIGIWLVTRSYNMHPIKISRWIWIQYTSFCALVWMIYLLTFWPGMMSFDSIDQWKQMSAQHFYDNHPAFHTITIWLLTRIWLSPAIIPIAQIIFLSIVAGWSFFYLQRLGLPVWLVRGACLIFAFSPVNTIFVITLWKDIPYSISLLILTVIVLLIISSNGAWLAQRKNWLLMGGVLALVALFRHNGLSAAFGTPLILSFFYKKQARSLMYALGISIVVWLIIKGPVYQLIEVDSFPDSPSNTIMYLPLQQIAAHINAKTPITSQEQIYLDAIIPIDSGWPYNCSNATILMFSDKFNPGAIDAINNYQQLFNVFISLFQRNPWVNLSYLFCQTSLIWEIPNPVNSIGYITPIFFDPDGSGYNGYNYIYPNSIGLNMSSKFPALVNTLARFYPANNTLYGYDWIFWRPAVYLYLLLTGAIVAAWRNKNRKILLITVPVLLHSAFLTLIIPAQDTRYQYPIFLVCLVLWPILFFGNWLNMNKHEV